MRPPLQALTFASLVILALPSGATAQSAKDRLCDTQYEDCRAPILQLIRSEPAGTGGGIDVAFWFMEDALYVHELINARNRGVQVRILVDQRANSSKPRNITILNMLRNGGLPMREKYVGDILHFKMMLFTAQNVVQFSKANYTPSSYVPDQANVNYFDEAVFFTDDDNVTNSFRQRFDDLWTNTTQYRDFANLVSPPVRHYPTFPIHSSMNFPPLQDFSTRSVARYNSEREGIDAIVFRVTDHRHANGMIAAVARQAPVRLITEPSEYRNPERVWHAKHVDRMWVGGVQIKMRQHAGLMHQASVVMHGLGEVIFGSSNWTTASASWQDEHNYFYHPSLNKRWFFDWFADQFESKWNDTANYVPFQPLPPGTPSYTSPPNFTAGQSSSVTLTWDGGPWAHFYDIYLGTNSDPPLFEIDKELGSPEPGVRETFTVSNLLPGTTYYWRIVGKTWAQRATSGPTWSFSTSGTPPGLTPYGGNPAAVPGIFQAENFDEGGPFVAYYDTTAGNSGGAHRPSPSGVDIEATSDTGSGYNLMKTRVGEWLKYTVDVAATGSYQLETRVANVGAGAAFKVEVDGVERSGPIAVPNTGGWQTWQTITTAGIPLTSGVHVIRVVFVSVSSGGGAGNLNWFRLVQSGAPPSPTTPWGGVPVPLPGVVQAEHFDVGASGPAYYDTSAGSSGNVFRTDTNVDIGPTNDPASGGYYLGWTRETEWLKYTVNVTQTRNYTLSVRVANVGSGAKFRIEVDGSDVTGPLSVPNTGGWDLWQPVLLSGIPLSEGQRVIRLVMVARNTENAGVGNYSYFSFQ